MGISVVIASYNRAHTLPRALASVMSQSLAADEIIVADDGSTDATGELLARDFPGVRHLALAHGGVSAARNRAIASATQEWIAILDSDDAWQPEKLQRQVQVLAQHPDHRLVHTDEIWIRNGIRVNPMAKHAKRGGWIFQHCLPLCAISPSSVLIHRSVFDDFGCFDESLPACEDYDLWLRLCSRMPVLFVEDKLTIKYGGHEDQLSRHFWGMDRFRVTALEKILALDCLSPDDRRAASRTLVDKAEILRNGARKRGREESVQYYQALIDCYQGLFTSGVDKHHG